MKVKRYLALADRARGRLSSHSESDIVLAAVSVLDVETGKLPTMQHTHKQRRALTEAMGTLIGLYISMSGYGDS